MHEYGLKFIQLSLYAPKIVKYLRSKMSLFVVGLGPLPSKEDRATMLIGGMDISSLMVYVKQGEEEKMKDGEGFKNKRSNIGNESGKQKNNVNRSSFQQK